MNILLINHYGCTPSLGRSMRTFELAQYLYKRGHSVEFIVGGNNPVISLEKKLRNGYKSWTEDGVDVLMLGLWKYTQGNNFLRVLFWFQMLLKILLLPNKLKRKPDIIIYSSLSLPGVFASLLISKIYNVPHIFEVRDIWPMTLSKLKKLPPYHPVVFILSCFEWIGYKYSDAIVTSMPGGIDRVREVLSSDSKKVNWIPNGVTMARFTLQADRTKNSIVKVVYLGTIGIANSLITLVKAAEALAEYKSVCFEIYGDGPERVFLQDYIDKNNLINIIFKGSVAQLEVPSILNCADILFHGSNDSELYKFGISPNKLSEYMAAGRPILNSYSGGYDPVIEGDSGLSSKAGDIPALVANIKTLAENYDLRILLGKNARQQAIYTYDYDIVNGKYLALINNVRLAK
jgi:glycosyltransferase involved in cell wall biosynthesis